ncbi:TIGR03960 family B12-binding radical SAM protein [Chlamydiota bacterium]
MTKKIKSLRNKIEEILPRVQKPARYVGNEYNCIRKNWEKVEVRVVLGFPDTYEIGMSHLGSRIIYGIINDCDYALCERVYSPWVDMENELRQNDIPLFSIESFRPITAFDVFGISLQYELTYTNILALLSLGKIPLFSKDRDVFFPIIVAGGPCTVNPEPMKAFIDVFVIGDGEELMIELLAIIREEKKRKRKDEKQRILKQFSELEGVYVPSFYTQGIKIKKRKISSIEKAYFPSNWIVPNTGIIHDRIMLEIMRGCSRLCRFCQAAAVNLPVRYRSPEKICSLASLLIENTGYEEISLTGLSINDYPNIEDIVRKIIESSFDKKVAVGLPSSRIDAFSVSLANQVQRIRKTGITFAPEAGSEWLRSVLKKDITDEKILESVSEAFKAGWKTIKLYFMIGLPRETMNDIQAIVDIIKEIKRSGMCYKKKLQLNVSISNFVPKPHTPFQWVEMNSEKVLHEKQEYLLKNFRYDRTVHLKFHNRKMSILEAILSRGGQELHRVIYNAWRLGARFDGWNELFDFEIWEKAFNQSEIHFDALLKKNALNNELYWNFIDVGISEKYLKKEYAQAFKLQRE